MPSKSNIIAEATSRVQQQYVSLGRRRPRAVFPTRLDPHARLGTRAIVSIVRGGGHVTGSGTRHWFEGVPPAAPTTKTTTSMSYFRFFFFFPFSLMVSVVVVRRPSSTAAVARTVNRHCVV